MGTFTGARRYVLHTFANTESALMKKRVARYHGERRLPALPWQAASREALAVKFAGRDIAEISALPLKQLARGLRALRRRDSAKDLRELPRSIRRRRS